MAYDSTDNAALAFASMGKALKLTGPPFDNALAGEEEGQMKEEEEEASLRTVRYQYLSAETAEGVGVGLPEDTTQLVPSAVIMGPTGYRYWYECAYSQCHGRAICCFSTSFRCNNKNNSKLWCFESRDQTVPCEA